MNKRKRLYDDAEMAGIRLACHAIKRNTAKVARRYPNDGTRLFCLAIDTLCTGVLDAVNEQRPYSIDLYTQHELPDYYLSDDAYGKIE